MKQSFIVLAFFGILAIAQSQWKVTIGQVGKKTFYLFEGDHPVSWIEAVKTCEKKKLRLAALKNSDRNEFVSSFLVKKKTAFGDGNVLRAWLGGFRNNSEGKWYWAGSNKTISNSNWSEGEPVEGKDLNCMYISDNGDNSPIKWRTNHCESNFAFPLCQSL